MSEKQSLVVMGMIRARGLTDDGCQPNSELTSPTVDSLTSKEKTRIACWNVRTLYQTAKFAQVVREFQKYGLDILGVCEARWTGSGQRTFSIWTYHTIFRQIGWPSYRGSGLDHEQENGEGTH